MATYDAVIVGGSFAGLAVAGGLRGNVLLIEKKEIGSHTASACLTLLSTLEELDCMDAVVRVYETGYIHTSSATVEFRLPFPLCTFDYRKFCDTLRSRLEAQVVRANALGLRDGAVLTDEGAFSGTCVVDASGWRAVLASSLEPGFVDRSKMSFGIEMIGNHRPTNVAREDGGGLHFWVDPRLIRRGVGWFFQRRAAAGIGVGSYIGETKLKPCLEWIRERTRAEPAGIHGGFFPWRMRKPTVGGIFLVGDAAGQCLPLTGEGIRPGMYFGRKCAEIVQQVIDGELPLAEGLERYENLVRAFGFYYRLLEGLQKGLLSLPGSWLTRFLLFLSKQSRCDYVLRRYERRLNLSSLAIKPRIGERAVSD